MWLFNEVRGGRLRTLVLFAASGTPAFLEGFAVGIEQPEFSEPELFYSRFDF